MISKIQHCTEAAVEKVDNDSYRFKNSSTQTNKEGKKNRLATT